MSPSTTLPTAAVDRRSGLRRIAAISASLVGTYALTSVLGLAFWLLAARSFPVAAVGVAGAAVALMTLLGSLGTWGLGTLLIARLPLTPQGERRVLVRTSLTVAGASATVLALVVPFVAIHVLHVGHLDSIAGGWGTAGLLAAGTGLMAVSLVADQAVLVVGNGALQTERNALASSIKLLVLVALALTGTSSGMAIFLAWSIGTLVSLPLVAWRTRGGRSLETGDRLLDVTSLRGLGRLALSHHALNTTLQAPLQILPLLVLVLVSTADNGVFTTALQVTGVVFTLPYAISLGLFASADGEVRHVLDRMRMTLPLSLAISLTGYLLLFPLAPLLLSVFGATYSAEGVEVLRVLALAGLPFVVKDHFVALRRVQGRTASATAVMVGTTVLELAAAYVGAQQGGTVGLCVAWLGVLVLEALVYAVPLSAAALSYAREATIPATPISTPATANTAAAAAVPRTTATGTATTPGWRRAARLIGPGPVLALMSSGLVLEAVGVTRADGSGPRGLADLCYVLGLVTMFAPAALGVLLPGVRGSSRVLLAVGMAVLLQVSRLVLYPTRFMFHDELIHANLLHLIGVSGHPFTDNSLLPITGYYPGLEVATNGVAELLGLSDHTSAVVILLLARVVLTLAVLLVITRLTGSVRAGATGVMVYACNPQMLFFNSQYSYQSLALPLATLSVYLVLSRSRTSRVGLVPAALATVATVYTHHVTGALLVAAFAVWLVLEIVVRRKREHQGAALATITGIGAAAFVATLLNPGNTLPSYLGSIGASSVQAVTGVLTGQQKREVFANSAGVQTPAWEEALIVASLVLTLAVLVPALIRSRKLLSGRVSLVVLLLVLALLYPLIPAGHLTVSTAEVGDRSAGFVFLGVAFVVAWWIWRRRMRWWRSVVLAIGATTVFLGSIILGAGSVSQQLPGPFRVSADARSMDADNIAAADWMDRHLRHGSVVYADRAGGLLAAAYGHQDSVTHIATDVDASRLLLDPSFGRADLAVIRAAHIRYLVADRRDAYGLPNQGVYIESGEFGSDNRTQPPPAKALRKFSSVPGVDVIYDNGSIVIYDLKALDAKP